MSKPFKRVLFIFLLLLLFWGMVIVYWQATHRMPDGVDAFLYLIALPLALWLGYLLLRKSIDVIKHGLKTSALAVAAAGTAPAAAAGAPAGGTAGESAGTAATSLPDYRLLMLASAARLPQAEDAGALLVSMAEPDFSPTVDVELKDSLGKPLLTSRLSDLDTQALLVEWSPVALTHGYDETLPPSWLRSIGLAQPLLDTLFDQTQALVSPEITPFLHVFVVVPSSWHVPLRELFARLLEERVLHTRWTKGKYVLKVVPDVTESGTASPLAFVDQWALSVPPPSSKEPRGAEWCLLMAVDSSIDPACVQQWENTDTRWVPAEGVAGVLLSTLAREPSATDQAIIYHRLAQDSSHKVPVVFTDTDYRPGRLAEVMAAVKNLFGDDTPNCQSPGQSTGYLGGVASLAALVAAHTHAQQKNQPALCLLTYQLPQRVAVEVTLANPSS